MTYRGRVKNGVVVVEDSARLPEGAEVRNEVEPERADPPTWGEVFQDVAGKAVNLPEDMARNHDHYLHGAPKR